MQHQTVQQPTSGAYRIAFDTVLGVEPLTIPVPATTEDITKRVRDAFEATDFSGITSVDVDLDGGQVTIADKDGPFEWASITHVEEPEPTPEPADPRQIAWQIVINGVASGLPIPAEVSIPGHYEIFDIRLPQNDQDGTDAWAAHLGLSTPKLEKPLDSRTRSYRVGTYDLPPMPGWLVRVSCFVVDGA